MAMSASCEITNSTGSTLLVTSVGPVNDDPTWSAPPVGTKIPNGKSITISMGNSSVPFAPRGVGFDLGFVCQENFSAGGIRLDDPAVGAHSFTYGNTGVFKYTPGNPGGNSYTIGITLV